MLGIAAAHGRVPRAGGGRAADDAPAGDAAPAAGGHRRRDRGAARAARRRPAAGGTAAWPSSSSTASSSPAPPGSRSRTPTAPACAPFWPDVGRFRDVVARYARAGFACSDPCHRRPRGPRDARRVPRGRHAARGRAPRRAHRDGRRTTCWPASRPRASAASMQPIHLEGMRWRPRRSVEPDAGARAGGPRLPHGRPARSGALLALGSDWPVARYDPRRGMAWSRLRREPGRRDEPAYGADQVLDGLADAARATPRRPRGWPGSATASAGSARASPATSRCSPTTRSTTDADDLPRPAGAAHRRRRRDRLPRGLALAQADQLAARQERLGADAHQQPARRRRRRPRRWARRAARGPRRARRGCAAPRGRRWRWRATSHGRRPPARRT